VDIVDDLAFCESCQDFTEDTIQQQTIVVKLDDGSDTMNATLASSCLNLLNRISSENGRIFHFGIVYFKVFNSLF
jgi:hypothetical protein